MTDQAGSYDPLSWDSDFFGVPIGRVQYKARDDDWLHQSIAGADADGIRCLYMLCPADDDLTLQRALDAGFRPYDVRVELDRSLDAVEPRCPSAREACDADEPALVGIAKKRFQSTRFFADPHFSRQRCQDLYVAWLRRGLADTPHRRTYIVGEVEGFVVCRFDASRGVGAIELVALAPEALGQGLGADLVQSADSAFVRAGLRRSEVATQARNVPAQRLYQRQGYLTRRVGVWLHRWREPAVPAPTR